jgi:hypothetical protein
MIGDRVLRMAPAALHEQRINLAGIPKGKTQGVSLSAHPGRNIKLPMKNLNFSLETRLFSSSIALAGGEAVFRW